jgi:hypothetical protein
MLISEYEDTEKKFDKLKDDAFGQGIRIKINKEYRVVSHMEKAHENTNLLFYNFNAFKDSQIEGSST